MGGFSWRVRKAWSCLASTVERPWLAFGWAISLFRRSGLGKQSFGLVHVGPPFLAMTFFLGL